MKNNFKKINKLFAVFVVILMFIFIYSVIDIDPAENPAINLWFLPGQSGEARGEIEQLINSAEKSIYIAVYDINDENLVNDLLFAHQKGIDVRVIMDNEEAADEWDIVSSLDSKNILRTDHSTSNFMHNKFMIIDGIEVWTGSTNWTENGLFYNNNNSLLINSKELADNYTAEFSEMWNGEFGAKSPANTPYPDISVGDINIQCYFAPEDHVEDHIVSVIENAQSSIDFATFTFTSIPIKEAIIKKIKQGVRVRGIYEARQKSQWCTYDDLKEAGANVIYDGNPKTMHHKVFIIDNEIVITGSYNPTKHANTSNDENVLILTDKNLAKQYEKEFNSLFYEWGGEK